MMKKSQAADLRLGVGARYRVAVLLDQASNDLELL
jgi:hypothetical protein